MPKPPVRLPLLLLLVALAGCGPSRPVGTSEEEWRRPTPAQRLEARRKQAELDRERRARWREERLRRERELERLAERYARARPEDFVTCVLEGGEVRFGEDWGRYVPVEFTLLRGEERQIEVERRNGRDRKRIWVVFGERGNRVRLCSVRPERASGNECSNLVASPSAFRHGVRERLRSKKLFRDVLLSCRRPRHRPAPTVIIVR